MAKKKNNTGVKVSGINVYEDDKGRPFYYDRFTKYAYLLKDVEKTYQFYSMRFILGFVSMIVAYSFNIGLVYSILLGVLIYGFTEYRFRVFLSRLTKNKNFVPKSKASRVEAELKNKTEKIGLKCILFVALGVLLIVNAKQENFEGFVVIVNYAFVLFSFLMAIFEGFVFIKKIRMN